MKKNPLGRVFRADLTLVIPEGAWTRAGYAGELNAEGVQEFLQNALFVGTDQVFVSVNTLVDENE
jgi:hypothetical protein